MLWQKMIAYSSNQQLFIQVIVAFVPLCQISRLSLTERRNMTSADIFPYKRERSEPGLCIGRRKTKQPCHLSSREEKRKIAGKIQSFFSSLRGPSSSLPVSSILTVCLFLLPFWFRKRGICGPKQKCIISRRRRHKYETNITNRMKNYSCG